MKDGLMSMFITDLADATPDWLTALLRERGALGRGHVVQIAHRRVNASSAVAHLHVRYSTDAPASVPEHLVLKLTNPELEGRMPRRNRPEIALYRALDGATDALPIVRCFDARYVIGPTDRFQLLLEDPSATTHVAHLYSAVPPTMDQCEQIVDALATVHARFWGDLALSERLEASRRLEFHSAAPSRAFVDWSNEIMPRFLADLGDRLPTGRRALYEHIGATLPERVLDRHTSSAHLTLTQGDVHLGNFLYPRDPAAHQPYIIDWKRAGFTLGANDLAYMMALYWFPPIRAQRELPLLRRYHERLLALGVTRYSWADLWDDYRLSVLRQLFEAIWGWSVQQNSTIWWNHLERVTLAIEDLGCLDTT